MQAQDTPHNDAILEALPGQAQSNSTEASPPETPVVDSTPSLEEMIRLAELKASEHHDAWLRAKAETENVRRRAAEDIAKASKFAVERFAKELLAVKDSLEAGLAIESPSAESLKSGTELTLKQLVAAFEKSGLKDINPVGEKFDPHFHQAISMIEADQEPNTVVSVLQKGYLLAERVLRPALVVVAKAKA
jgi:molecular chaperone GrpE